MRKVMLVVAVLVGCGDDGSSTQVDAAVKRDAAIDAAIDAPPCTGAKTLFLNRAGGTYNGGAMDDATTNTTKVLGTGSHTVPGYPFGDPSWVAMKTCVESAFSALNVNVVDVDPGSTPHHEIVLTTTYATWPNGNNNV